MQLKLKALSLVSGMLLISTARPEPFTVGVIGGGIAGAASAFFLNEEAQERGIELEITILERDDAIGGRTKTIDFGGLRIDAGATAISTLNEYLVSFVERWGFETDADDDGTDGAAPPTPPTDELGRAARLGIWDGSAFRVDTREGLALPLTVAERYGLSPLRSVKAVREAAGGLGGIYAMQEQGRSFESPSEMFAALGILNFTQTTAYDFFDEIGVDEQFVLEFVDGASRDNYNQNGNINAFVDLVSLAGAGIDGSVFSLKNGTQQITETLATESGATVLVNANVTRVESVDNGQRGQVRVSWQDENVGEGESESEGSTARPVSSSSRTFDAVVIATPLEMAGGLQLDLSGSGGDIVRDRPYQTTHTTFVDGALDLEYFNISPVRAHPYDILTMEVDGVEFSSVGFHGPGTERGASIYKLFSRQELDDATLDRIFTNRSSTLRLSWLGAYPKLDPVDDETWPRFDLNSGGGVGSQAPVMYVNAMESPVSCMETEIISAKNAALRIADSLTAA